MPLILWVTSLWLIIYSFLYKITQICNVYRGDSEFCDKFFMIPGCIPRNDNKFLNKYVDLLTNVSNVLKIISILILTISIIYIIKNNICSDKKVAICFIYFLLIALFSLLSRDYWLLFPRWGGDPVRGYLSGLIYLVPAVIILMISFNTRASH